MLIRKSHLSDFLGVHKLISSLRPDIRYDFEEMNFVFLKALKMSNQFYISAIDNEKVVGFCSLSVKNSLWQNGYLGHIDELVVDKKYRRKGIGTMLMETAMKLAEEQNCKRLELDGDIRVNAGFFGKLGFESRSTIFTRSIVTPEAV